MQLYLLLALQIRALTQALTRNNFSADFGYWVFSLPVPIQSFKQLLMYLLSES